MHVASEVFRSGLTRAIPSMLPIGCGGSTMVDKVVCKYSDNGEDDGCDGYMCIHINALTHHRV